MPLKIASRIPWAGAAGLALSVLSTAAQADGFVRLSNTGPTVLTRCNQADRPNDRDCLVTSLPGLPGFRLVASRSAPIIINDVTVGTSFEKVWQKVDSPRRYVFGVRVQLNASQWDLSGQPFRINDLSRRTRTGKAVSVAYSPVGDSRPLARAGRTAQGLNEYDDSQPERDNTWLDFRINAAAGAPGQPGNAKSPWLLVETAAPKGYALAQFGLRALNSDYTDPTLAVDLYTAAYQPNGVPAGDDDDDD